MSTFYGGPRDTKSVTLTGVLESMAKDFPQKEALKFKSISMTYEKLEKAVLGLANLLREKGVKKESLVGIYMDRSEKMIISILAVMKAGGAYVPLDPSHPNDRNRYIIEKSHINTILSESKYESVFEDLGNVISLDIIWDDIINGKCITMENMITEGNQLAYVIFTSGSTGNPKGVEVEHEGMMNYLYSVSDNLGLDDSARGLTVVTITFDISISEMFLPLINGGTLVVADNDTAKDGISLRKLMEEEHINLCGFTPSTAYMLLDAGLNLTGMKMLIGGEPWSISLALEILKNGCSQLWNVYGPTETTIYSTMYNITEKDTYIPIGPPIDQTDIYVLDENMNPIEKGQEGDLYIGGIGVARGYFENEELTKDRFIQNPVDPERGRIYKTGDIVKYTDNGDVVYVGRSDFQVKVHGYRIELGEIEAGISKHEDVAQAVVVVCGEELNAQIHAFIKLKPDKDVTASDMKAFLDNVLPYYMIPNRYTFVDEYPMTANLKVDRKALMLMNNETDNISSEYVAPRNEIEEMVADIWMELLKVDKVSVCDDFLELGGHSLLANRLVTTVNKDFGTNITLVEFFSRPMTIEEMSMMIEENLLAGLTDEEIEAIMNGE
ncbi:MAG: amino acid adenylation domain-containing protein [Lachnospiraceae bacterium]|nr:amino acid adenylation domain-containing protein [Lachnospiraceae bacterium]